jgi:hypothetical protein
MFSVWEDLLCAYSLIHRGPCFNLLMNHKNKQLVSHRICYYL